MNTFCVDPDGSCGGSLVRSLVWTAMVSVFASGCVTRPPSQVEIHPVNTSPGLYLNTDAPTSLSVCTFNVWGLPTWLNGASPQRYQKIAAQLSRLGTDVVLLQEVWTRRSFTELSEQSKGAARTWWTASARLKGTFLGQNGLLTLSRYPIAGAEVKHFSAARLPDSL